MESIYNLSYKQKENIFTVFELGLLQLTEDFNSFYMALANNLYSFE